MGAWYQRLNGELRGWIVNEKMVNDISAAMKKMPNYEWEVYRWINLSDGDYQQFVDLKVWDVFTDPAFMSTSTSESVAKSFMDTTIYSAENKVMLKIKSKNGKFIWNAWESEILFDRWTQFKVIQKNTNWKTINIYLEEI